MRNKCLTNIPNQKPTRQFLRINQTEAEGVLWQYLRGKGLGAKFVRQFGIGKYIVDFCCRSKKLIIELDGEIYNDNYVKENDQERAKDLESFGYKIIRFKNWEVSNNLETI